MKPYKELTSLTDRCLSARGTVHGRNLEETVGIDFECSHKFRLATGHGRNSSQLEFSQQAIITALSTFTLVSEPYISCYPLGMR
jgi:hypothetical protein